MKKSLQTINSQIALPEQCQLLVKHYKCIFDWFLVNYGIQTIQGIILILEVNRHELRMILFNDMSYCFI